MARIASAKKANRAALRRRVFNLRRKKAVKDVVKEISKLVSAKDTKAVEAKLPALYRALDKAAKSGVIKKNTAARLKSRVVKRLRALA